MKRKISLVGLGKIACDQHIPAIAASPDWELAATVSRHGSVAGIENFSHIDEMLEARPDIRVVSLCLPPAPRFEYARKAIIASRHVMLEKPPGTTVTECHVLQGLASEIGVSIYATWHSREAAVVARARDWLADKRLRRLRVVWKEDVRRWHPGQDWLFEPGGFGVFDPGINALSIVTKILPDPIHLISGELLIPQNRKTPIAASLAFHHPHNAAVSVDFDWRQEGDQIWTIVAETDGGVLMLTEGGTRLEINGVETYAETGLSLASEYPKLYARMAQLVDENESDFDLTPLVHVAKAFVLSRQRTTAPFHW